MNPKFIARIQQSRSRAFARRDYRAAANAFPDIAGNMQPANKFIVKKLADVIAKWATPSRLASLVPAAGTTATEAETCGSSAAHRNGNPPRNAAVRKQLRQPSTAGASNQAGADPPAPVATRAHRI